MEYQIVGQTVPTVESDEEITIDRGESVTIDLNGYTIVPLKLYFNQRNKLKKR